MSEPLAQVIRRLEEGAPRLYARWSPNAWRLCCEGPALALWDALARSPDPDGALVDFLVLLREAVGLQYLSAAEPADLDPANPMKAGASFLSAALCGALPRLLPSLPARERAHALARVWNVGEKLASQPAWLNRYLAARLTELDSLSRFEEFLSRAVAEGMEPPEKARWSFPMSWTVLDASPFDRSFLPGPMHFATPSIVCVHDRRRADRQLGVLLRRARQGGPLCLGATPCLGESDARPANVERLAERLFTEPQLPEHLAHLASPGGLLVLTSPLSQRLWVGESES